MEAPSNPGTDPAPRAWSSALPIDALLHPRAATIRLALALLGLCGVPSAAAPAQDGPGEAGPILRLEREVPLSALGTYDPDTARSVYVPPTGEILVLFKDELRLLVFEDGEEVALRRVLDPPTEAQPFELQILTPRYTFAWRGNYYLRYALHSSVGGDLPGRWFACYGETCGEEAWFSFQKASTPDPRYVWTYSPVAEPRALGERAPMHRIDVPMMVHALDEEGQPARFVRQRTPGAEHLVLFHNVLAMDVDPAGELVVAHLLPGKDAPTAILRASERGLVLARHTPPRRSRFRQPVLQLEAGAEGRVLLADGANALWTLSPSGGELLPCTVEGLPPDEVRAYHFSRDGRALYAFPFRGPIFMQVLRVGDD